MQKTFDTSGPITLYVELGSGDLRVHAEETTQATVHVDGRDADEVVVEQRGDQIVVLAPRRKTGFFGVGNDIRVTATVPVDSDLVTKCGSADVTATGRYGAARIKAGSGEVRISDLTGDSTIETGSGDVAIDTSLANLRIKAGSGDVGIERVAGATVIATGSGSIFVGRTEDEAVVRSGSGDVQVKDALTDLSVTTASGDLRIDTFRVGTLKAKGVSGDVHVGVPAGIPVWTDISSVSGSIHSTLEGAGQPTEGQDFIELRATTVSGDILLQQL
jgi:DUF4097 and DUF4098 domain-containing protein YvlB